MNTKRNTYTKIALHVVHYSEPEGSVKVIFRPAAYLAGLGIPGKHPGDINLNQTIDGTIEVIVSLGEESKISTDVYRQAGGYLARWIRQAEVENLDMDINQFGENPHYSEMMCICEGIYLGAFSFDQYKTNLDKTKSVTIHLRTDGELSALSEYIAKVELLANSVNLSRNWAHEPANVINPVSLAKRIQELADQNSLTCTILDYQSLTDMKSGGLLSVGKGSKSEPKMIILEYPGQSSLVGTSPVVLVGKAITFDSGGYSLKNVDSIQGMKYDKCGGVTVAAILQACATLKIQVPVVGIICAAENMISADAYRPDDIITSLSGKTIEIISTDAEGRLVLADGLTYAQRQYNPREIIDLATLTGGVVVALGHVRAGFMSNNDDLADRLIRSGENTHERLWRLPLDDDYFDQIKSDDADIKNSGGREAQPVIGGIFLKQFVDDKFPWAHIDIAGVANANKDEGYNPKGATGFGVRLILNYLREISS